MQVSQGGRYFHRAHVTDEEAEADSRQVTYSLRGQAANKRQSHESNHTAQQPPVLPIAELRATERERREAVRPGDTGKPSGGGETRRWRMSGRPSEAGRTEGGKARRPECAVASGSRRAPVGDRGPNPAAGLENSSHAVWTLCIGPGPSTSEAFSRRCQPHAVGPTITSSHHG